jgi:sugar diacid utilization regulator/putative methionine-R-sulfoxide reductase with GAF domain
MNDRLTQRRAQSRGDLAGALEPFAAAAMRGQYELLLAEAERAVVRLFPAAQARVIVRTGGAWHEWSRLEHGGEGPAVVAPMAIDTCELPLRTPTFVFAPVVPGALGIRIDGDAPDVEDSDDLAVLRRFFALALQTCERQRVAAQNLDEVQSLQRVATRMLQSHDLSEILLLITQEAKRLLSADICGVLLRESDRIVMRRCVGNRSPLTATLQMGPGQGLAGLVLEHSEPACVEDYMASELISRDFFHLAEAEMVRSALAAPLIGRSNVIGVLEVWRRRPSTFTPLDTMRLVALSNLTSIAIENAELYASQTRMVDELGRANEALNQRYNMVRSASSLMQNLMQLLLQGAGLQGITNAAAAFLNTEIGVVDEHAHAIAWSGPEDGSAVLEEVARTAMPQELARTAMPHGATTRDVGAQASTVTVQGHRWRVQPVVVEGSAVAWVLGRIVGTGEALAELTLAQVAMVAALHRLEQRAASRARSETIDAIIWDLLRADDAARAAAIDRASDVKLDLDGPLRLYLCELGTTLVPTESSSSTLRQLVARTIGSVGSVGLVVGGGLRAVAMQGTLIAVLCADQIVDDAERFAQRLVTRLSEALDGRLVVGGGSSRCLAAGALNIAFREAQIALDVSRQIGRCGAVVYDRAGVVGMLLSLCHEVGMRRFLELNLGQLLLEEDKHRDLLLQTMRVFFDVNCSHEVASQRLGVHRKTIAHRLGKISELTGLDLTTHDDRLVADLALYVHRMLADRPGKIA